MWTDNNGLIKLIASILLFPAFFQNAFIQFSWGAGDPTWLMSAKRLFLLLPVLALILGCWVTVAAMLTVLVRQNRREFITALLITWWDLGKAIVAFWGGVVKFVYTAVAAMLTLAKVAILSFWALVQDIIFAPFRLLRSLGQSLVSSPVPWIAVSLTLFWCTIEAFIFTYVTSPLVIDTFSNITGEQLSETVIRIPLFIFLFFIVLGSYAVLSTFMGSVRDKKVSAIAGIGVIEVIVLFVEVIFLYREFVDSLIPWVAQYSPDFDPGIGGILLISCFVWFGVRSLSWLLFASHGTAPIMAVIQGKGLAVKEAVPKPDVPPMAISSNFVSQLKEQTDWIQTRGEDLLADLMLPPLQVVAAAINFLTLLVNGNHLFEIPFKRMADISESRLLLRNVSNTIKPDSVE